MGLKRRRVIFVVYEGFELLDLAGPSGVFSSVNDAVRPGAYEICLVSAAGGPVKTGHGLVMQTEAARDVRVSKNDTVLIVGAGEEALVQASRNEALLTFMKQSVGRAERVGSICSGTFLLGFAGLLDGKRVATHWAGCRQLAELFPGTDVVPDALYVNDGQLWTSAGVTTGIDMALAVVELDHGRNVMGQVAKLLIVYAHRPGNQSQFSALLDAQTKTADAFSDLIEWLNTRLDASIKVSDMANHMGMSERTFHRKFIEQVHQTPSKFLEHLRLEKAKLLIEAGEPIKAIAPSVGFKSEAGFRSAFEARFGLAPSVHRKMHHRHIA